MSMSAMHSGPHRKRIDIDSHGMYSCIQEYRTIKQKCKSCVSCPSDDACDLKGTNRIVRTFRERDVVMNDALSGQVVTNPKTIAEQVYDLLKMKILDHEIVPGERLLEVATCEQLQVSRTPVREAFRLLQQDGLVERIPQGGVRVTDISLDELQEISRLRTILEVYAVELACDRISSSDLERLEHVIDQASQITAKEQEGEAIDVSRLSHLNTVFHDIICEAAQSTYLNKVLEIVRLPILRFRPFSLEDRKHRQRSLDEHKRIIQMLKEQDKKGLKKLISKHVNDVGDAVARTLAAKKGN